MGRATLVILAVFAFVFISLAEGSCKRSKSCSRVSYRKVHDGTFDCGWWKRCNKYKSRRDVHYYRCYESYPCPKVHGGWSSWTSWSGYGSCSKTCGYGSQTRTRYRYCNRPSPKYGGRQCSGSSRQNQAISCHRRSCPINGGWGTWTKWSNYGSCSKTCGGGVQTRSRTRRCSKPSPRHGGKQCVGDATQKSKKSCNTKACPVDGKWGKFAKWSKWGSCSATCGYGTKTRSRSRSCNSPAPKNGGKSCVGKAQQTSKTSCKNGPKCPIDGGWTKYGKWSKWTECSETCGLGVQKSTRRRSCTKPKPQFGGKQCVGDEKDERTKQCKVKDCPVYCECRTVGDSHYKTFDGQWIHFLGACQFQLAESVETKCPFSVVVINKAASQTTSLPYKRTIEFTFKKAKITLLPNKRVLYDGAKVNLPYTTKDKKVDIFISGRYVRIETHCGINLEWDGDKLMELAVKDKIAKRMTGICGNCDEKKNDLKKKDGTDVSGEENKNSLIAESFALKEKATENGQTCGEITEVPTASDEVATIASSDKYCGYLRSKKNGTSPFQKCLDSTGIDPEDQYDMCVTDVSLYYNKNNNHLNEAVCNNLEAFALECDENDVAVKWRSDSLCPLSCGTNQVYSERVSGCQANCVNKKSEKSCHLPFTEGCACKDGYILSGHGCVKEEDCGCTSKVGYIALDEEVMSDDCKIVYKCVRSSGKVRVKKEIAKKCHKHAVCGLNSDGDSTCKCKDGFEGDGIKECKTKEKDCKTSKHGKNYKGKKSQTISGKTCQAWEKQKPHSHRFTKLADDSNYCRNPDGEDKPWCYTTDKLKRWELCDVPDCDARECRERNDVKGEDYTGKKSTTVTGKTCQAWGSQEPHKHKFGGMETNYCRNPDGEPKPWCYTTDPNKRWDFCDIPLCEPEEVKQCKTDEEGADYNGHKNTTISGRTCQAWGGTKPHHHGFTYMSGDKNYCRNPDGEPKPWCYTTDPLKRWEFCDIPLC